MEMQRENRGSGGENEIRNNLNSTLKRRIQALQAYLEGELKLKYVSEEVAVERKHEAVNLLNNYQGIQGLIIEEDADPLEWKVQIEDLDERFFHLLEEPQNRQPI